MGAHQEHPQKGLKPVSVLREDSAVSENQKHLVLWDAGVEPSYWEPAGCLFWHLVSFHLPVSLASVPPFGESSHSQGCVSLDPYSQ